MIKLGELKWNNIIDKTYKLIKPRLDEFKITNIKEKDKYSKNLGLVLKYKL